jgi:dTMP kinase
MDVTLESVGDVLAEPGFPVSSSRQLQLALGDGPVDISSYPGRLISIEGTDGVGRSTHVALIREWLEKRGYAVAHSGLTRSVLAGDGLRQAKLGHTLGRLTLDLYYATDFADRLERDILPALRAGFVVLTDRYVYSTMARSIVRGTPMEWIERVYRFAPKPHAVFYLKVDVDQLTPRVLARGNFDFWESGLDFLEEQDLYAGFVRYQRMLLEEFDELTERFGFTQINANRPIREVFDDLRRGIEGVLSTMETPE